MYDAAKKDGITLYLRSGYRSIATQNVNYQADIQRNINKGYTREQAIIETEKYYARPGQSEHHTGLAFDIITPEYHRDIYTLNEQFAKTKAYDWLVKHCAEYGFILRYPKDKVDITKINYEPWHYRYVGIEHAKKIMENNLCLEEYLAQ
ncbi:M15 family metallopeptidase [Paludihabitans sp. MB14-C6]|uniref:M15 family metallopeptidase n=1 Tax=Paludihabitans sp. MB14-C6 TaxID=3070656 RepID=UPI003C12C1C6